MLNYEESSEVITVTGRRRNQDTDNQAGTDASETERFEFTHDFRAPAAAPRISGAVSACVSVTALLAALVALVAL